jgi:2-oxoglutarate ferredoxin oxidoreductase subunit alpha
MNIEAAQLGYDYAAKNFEPFSKKINSTGKQHLMITGNYALSLGAVAAGCKFYSAYPMTPASSILHWMASHSEKYGVLVKQAEDELAVINMAIGANFAGVRAMCGTSGGGFSLMAEALSQAGMTETPLVVVLAQRTGPSTGLPTKTEQGDLMLALGAGQGDFPRIIMAPRTVEECFYTAPEAFNLADRYQCPVIIITDLLLSEHYESVDSLNLKVQIDRGMLAEDDGGEYRRYAFTDTGISPRAFPGQSGHIFVAPTDEHDEKGNLVSDVLAGIPEYVDIRRKMMEKRMRKMSVALTDLAPPEIYGKREAEITLIGWGSTWGSIKEAIKILEGDGVTANSVQYKYLYPFKAEESKMLLNSCKRLMIVECNFTGQFARLLAMETGIQVSDKLLKYDGEPIYPSEIVSKVKQVLK